MEVIPGLLWILMETLMSFFVFHQHVVISQPAGLKIYSSSLSKRPKLISFPLIIKQYIGRMSTVGVCPQRQETYVCLDKSSLDFNCFNLEAVIKWGCGSQEYCLCL